MKLYLSLDMEGMPGTFNWAHEQSNREAVKRCFRTHVQDFLQAILLHPKSPDLEEIRIADSHSAGDNLDHDITLMDERITLSSGAPRPLYMMPGLETDFDQVWLIGYHAGTGALRGNMDHTYSNSSVHKIWINGQRMNEALINAAYAGFMSVPVCLASGDTALQNELLTPGALPWISYVPTKTAIAKFAARSYSALKVRNSIRQAVDSCLNKDKHEWQLYKFEAPITLKIEFNSSSKADQASLMPYTNRLDGRTIEFSDSDYGVIFEAIMALVTLASTVSV